MVPSPLSETADGMLVTVWVTGWLLTVLIRTVVTGFAVHVGGAVRLRVDGELNVVRVVFVEVEDSVAGSGDGDEDEGGLGGGWDFV